MSTTANDKKPPEAQNEYNNRQLRAVEEYLTVMPDAVDGEGIVRVVSQSGENYIVDTQNETCECGDFEHREGDENGRCKHIYRAMWATGREAIPVALVEQAGMEPNFGVFVDKSEIRYATADGGIVEAGRDAEILDADEDECEECAELSDMMCFECHMAEKGYGVSN